MAETRRPGRDKPAAPATEKPVPAERLTERTVQDLEKLIAQTGMAPGMKLPGERPLCQRFAVSRTVLREAIRILEQKGIVEVMPARGLFVAAGRLQAAIDGLSEGLHREALTFEELAEARRHLEARICELAAERRSQADLAILQANMSGLRAATDVPGAFIELDLAFHLNLARASGNRLLAIWLQPIMQNLLVTRQGVIVAEDVRNSIVEWHQRIVDAIAQRDPAGARRAMEGHIDQFVEVSRRRAAREAAERGA